jgi:hypothetical protein
MRKSLILVFILGALLLMPKEHTDHAGHAVDASSLRTAPVVFMGDSVTMGAHASAPNKMFVGLVYHDLQTRGIDATDDVIWTLDPYNDLRNAQTVAAQRRRLIIVEVGVHWASFDSAQFREVYGAMLDCLAGSGATVVVGTIPWLNWPPATPSYFEMAYYSQIIREEAAKRGIAVADIWAATDGRPEAVSRPGQPCFLWPACQGDNYHPGDVGHALIAAAYIKALDVALASPPPSGNGRCDLGPYVDALAHGTPSPSAAPAR